MLGYFRKDLVWRQRALMPRCVLPPRAGPEPLPTSCWVCPGMPLMCPIPRPCWHLGVPSRDRRDGDISQGCSAPLSPSLEKHRGHIGVEVPLIPCTGWGSSGAFLCVLQVRWDRIWEQNAWAGGCPLPTSPHPAGVDGEGLEGEVSGEERRGGKVSPRSFSFFLL